MAYDYIDIDKFTVARYRENVRGVSQQHMDINDDAKKRRGLCPIKQRLVVLRIHNGDL